MSSVNLSGFFLTSLHWRYKILLRWYYFVLFQIFCLILILFFNSQTCYITPLKGVQSRISGNGPLFQSIIMNIYFHFQTGHILPNSNSYIIFVFLTLAAIATIMFCFLISIFFSKAKLAAACGGIIYFVTYMPYIFISIQEGGSNHIDVSSNFKTVASL